MLRRLGLGLLLGATTGAAAWAQATDRFDGQYVGELTLKSVVTGDCTQPPPAAVYPLTISGGEVRFAYLPRFATVLTGTVNAKGTFKASARVHGGMIRMTGHTDGIHITAAIASRAAITPSRRNSNDQPGVGPTRGPINEASSALRQTWDRLPLRRGQRQRRRTRLSRVMRGSLPPRGSRCPDKASPLYVSANRAPGGVGEADFWPSATRSRTGPEMLVARRVDRAAVDHRVFRGMVRAAPSSWEYRAASCLPSTAKTASAAPSLQSCRRPLSKTP